MKTVGIRELKNRLSQYLRYVRAGGSVLVTDRGEIVAELGVPGRDVRVGSGGLEALAREGKLTLGTPNAPEAYPVLPPILRSRSAVELLDEERGSR